MGLLPYAWIDDFRYLIATAMSEPNTNIGAFDNEEREGILIIPTSGVVYNDTPGQRRPGVQITTRYASFSAANVMANQIFAYLNKTGNKSHGSTILMYSRAKQEPFAISRTQLNLSRMVCNYELFLNN